MPYRQIRVALNARCSRLAAGCRRTGGVGGVYMSIPADAVGMMEGVGRGELSPGLGAFDQAATSSSPSTTTRGHSKGAAASVPSKGSRVPNSTMAQMT